MTTYRRTFILWALAPFVLLVLANLPRSGGSLKPEYVWAGFPWTFAFWYGGRLERFDFWAFFGDSMFGIGVPIAVGLLCAMARDCHRRRRPSGIGGNDGTKFADWFPSLGGVA
jgi:hypothetical protein